MNIAEKYYWITEHPAYVPFGDVAVIEITPHMVCPETNCIEKLDFLNTKLRFWVEFMTPFYDEELKAHHHIHDWELDCGGDTWEEAVEALYQKVLEKYGDYTEEDADNHRKEAMKDFDMDSFFKNAKVISESEPNTDEIIPLLDYEIESFEEDIKRLERLLPVLNIALQKEGLTMQEYSDIELEIICIDHDLEVAKKSLELGYNVEKYGIREKSENSETDLPAE